MISKVLEEADRVINGPRRQSYGPVEESFEGVATVLNVVLRKKLGPVPLTGQDVALIMMSLKLCREANEHSWDNLVDMAGYAALKGALAGEPKQQGKEVSAMKGMKKGGKKKGSK